MLTRLAAVLALAAALVTGAAATPAGAVTPAEMDAAQARVQAVSAKVATVAVSLSDGTARWQAGTEQLARAQSDAGAAAARAEIAASVAAARQQTLSEFVAARYRHTSSPASGLLTTAAETGGVFAALRADADLARIRGSQAQALVAADAARLEAESARREAHRLQDEAAQRERDLAQQLAELEALADRTNNELQAALGDLDRLEAEQAAEQELLRLQAARDAAAGGLTPPPFVGSALAPGGCAGTSTGGYANGTIPASALCPLSYAPGQLLRADAAAAFNRLTEAAKQGLGAPLCVTDSYRSYASQVELYKIKPGLAAVPGTSNHGWGVAVDLCGGVQSFGTPAHNWLQANAGRFGWIHPSWAEPGGSRPEPWHWEFVG